MCDAAGTVERCALARGELSHRLGLATLAFATAVSYLLLIATLGVFDQLVVGVFVPLTVAFEWSARSHVGVCRLLTQPTPRLDGPNVALPTRLLPTSSGIPDAGTNRAVATRITILSVLAAALTTGLAFLVGTTLL